MQVKFCFLIDGKQHKARELDLITRDLHMIIV